jgi:hypothetical protein
MNIPQTKKKDNDYEDLLTTGFMSIEDLRNGSEIVFKPLVNQNFDNDLSLIRKNIRKTKHKIIDFDKIYDYLCDKEMDIYSVDTTEIISFFSK